ncbi:MAG: hypothetical protein NVV60_01585 [Luteimonas sp.]|nr:hypothetical protein [Luteimonas sp.]
MPDRYVIAPAHVVTSADQEFSDPHEASVAASRLVEKDKAPRVVLRVAAHVRVSPVPKVDVVIEEEGRG